MTSGERSGLIEAECSKHATRDVWRLNRLIKLIGLCKKHPIAAHSIMLIANYI